MCGRYKLTVPFREIVRLYNLTQPNASRFDNMQPRYNIAPTQDVAVVRLDAQGHAMLKPCEVPMEAIKVSPKVNQSKVDAPEVFEVLP